MTDTGTTEPADTTRKASTAWVNVEDMKVTPAAQRKYDPAHAKAIADAFDLEALGYPVVNFRAGTWWVIDGQHRVGALRLIGWGDQQIECEAYRGLTEQEEAALFLARAKTKAITPADRFRIAVTAGLPDEVAVKDLCEQLAMPVGVGRGKIQAVNTLLKMYRAYGPEPLGRALLILREAYGLTSVGVGAPMVEGMTLVVVRYGKALKTDKVIEKLQVGRAGEDRADAVLKKAGTYHLTTAQAKPFCTAAALVDKINAGRGSKLPDWWKSQATPAK